MVFEGIRQLVVGIVLGMAVGALLVTSCEPLEPPRPSQQILPTLEPNQGRPSPSIEIPPPIR